MNTNSKIELLAPAKDKNTAISAINAGADAVYIGYLKFGARKKAGNSLEDIKEVIDYAHKYLVKVYITFNTIFKDDELPEVLEAINSVYKAGVDGIIIQDMGLLELDLPPIQIIASTQCHNNTLEKVKFLEKTGFKRVILPREFSLAEIKNITENTNIEVETFVHGALCVSYSGQCYMSYAVGGRSANRGECAQPCRKKYSLKDSNGKLIVKDRYLLSLKDFNLSNNLKELIQACVTSFKIEGRLKDEDYVRNVVAFYRKELDKILKELNLERSSIGVSNIDFEPNPDKSFNRSFTTYFFNGRSKDISALNYSKSLGEYIGEVEKIDKTSFVLKNNRLKNSDGICFFDENNELQGTNINKVQGNTVFPNSMNAIKNGLKIYRNFDKDFIDKVLKSKIERKIPVDINVLFANNEYVFEAIACDGQKAVCAINAKFEPAKNIDSATLNIKKQLSKLGNTEFLCERISINLEEVPFIPVSELNDIRRNLFDKLSEQRSASYKNDVRNNKIEIVEYPEKNLDFRANIYNSKAKEFYEKRKAKVNELAAESNINIKSHVVMTTKHCLKYLFDMCPKQFSNNEYKEPFYIVDEYGKEYRLEFDCKNCLMQIIHK